MKGNMMKKLFVLFLLLFTTDSFSTGISGGTSAPCDNDTLSKYSGTVNAEINWEPNVIGLSWYDGNKLIDGPATCTYDGTITVPATPTKLGYTFNGWKVWKPTVPTGYTELQYIESSGTQWIDTGYIFPSNTTARVIMDVLYPSFTSESGWNVHGVSGSAYGGPNIGTVGSNNTRVFCAATSGDFRTDVNASANTRYLFDLDMPKRIFTVIDVATNTVLVNRDDFPNEYWNTKRRPSFRLFGYGRGQGNSPEIITNSSRIYSVKLYNNGTLVRYMMPARRNSDNVLGMWDTVTQTFFTNSGTGNFVAGPVAP